MQLGWNYSLRVGQPGGSRRRSRTRVTLAAHEEMAVQSRGGSAVLADGGLGLYTSRFHHDWEVVGTQPPWTQEWIFWLVGPRSELRGSGETLTPCPSTPLLCGLGQVVSSEASGVPSVKWARWGLLPVDHWDSTSEIWGERKAVDKEGAGIFVH